MPDTIIVGSFVRLLQAFVPCFTAPSFATFVALMGGWSLTTARHTVTGVVRAGNAVGWKHIRTFHRFFSEGSWLPDELGLILVRLVVERCIEAGAPVVVPIDDTLVTPARRSPGHRCTAIRSSPPAGVRSFTGGTSGWWSASQSPRSEKPGTSRRLQRGKKQCKAQDARTNVPGPRGGTHQASPTHFAGVIVGDSAYTNGSIILGRPKNVTVVGRSRLDALYAPPPKRRGRAMGRPRVRGQRLPSPAKQIANARWKRLEVTVYGRTVKVRVHVIDALWYRAGRSELMRLVVVRDFPGHERDDVFVSTNPSMTPRSIIETFSLRWSLEHTFHECKGKLGFEDPQNRKDRAVERTAPMALWLHSLVVLWYLGTGQHSRAARQPAMPWYAKTAPTFSDMLATLRRASWTERLSVPCANVQTLRKRIRPLIEALAA